MGTIQEALRELRKQRKIDESNKAKKPVKESLENDDAVKTDECFTEALLGDEDGDIEVTSFNLHNFYQECLDKKPITEEESSTADEVPAEVPAEEVASEEEVPSEEVAADEPEDDILTKLNAAIIIPEEDKELSAEDEAFNKGIQTAIDILTAAKDAESDDDSNAEGTEAEANENAEETPVDDENIEEALGDEDGDIEVKSFNLHDEFSESINEEKQDSDKKLTVDNVKNIAEYKDLPNKVVNKLITWAEDEFGANNMDDFVDWINGYNSLAECAIVNGSKLDATDFWSLVKDDEKFANVISKVCRKIGWTDNQGYYTDEEGSTGERKNGKKPSPEELTLEYITCSLPDNESKEYTFKILEDAYCRNNYSKLGTLDLAKILKK